MMIYSNGNFVYTIGGIPVGSGSTAPPPPPPDRVNLTIGGVPGLLSASAVVPGEGSISWTDGTAQLTGLPSGATVNASLKAEPGYAMHNVTYTGMSAIGASSMGDGSLYFTGYMTADTLVSAAASAMGPKEKTFFIASDSGSCTVSASAYINGTGEPVAVWTASNGSASASATVNYGDTIVVVTESNRPTGYSATIYSTGYSTSDPAYTTTGVIVSGTATYAGSNSAIMSAKYKGGQMVVSASGMMFDPLPYSVDKYTMWQGPLMLPNEISSEQVASIAYKRSADVTGRDERYSAYQYMLNISAYVSFRASATAYSRVTSPGDDDDYITYYLRQSNTNPQVTAYHELGYSSIDQSTSTFVELYGNGKIHYNMNYYKQPEFFAYGHGNASATITPRGWSFTGVLK